MIIHLPHSSTFIPDRSLYLVDIKEEINKVTDWYVDDLFYHSKYHHFLFPYSRLYCDVERLEQDPLEERGHGIYYTKSMDGTQTIRENILTEREKVMELYHKHHLDMATYVSTHLAYFDKITIVDAHSYSDEQAEYSEKDKRPDFCIGTDPFHTPDDMVSEVCSMIESEGYSVEKNNPFEGTLIPTFFYQKNKDVQGIMIEVNKRLYLTNDYQRGEDFEKVRSFIFQLLDYIERTTLPLIEP